MNCAETLLLQTKINDSHCFSRTDFRALSTSKQQERLLDDSVNKDLTDLVLFLIVGGMFLLAASACVLLLKPLQHLGCRCLFQRRVGGVIVDAGTSDFCRVCSARRVYRDCEMLRVGLANGLKTGAQP